MSPESSSISWPALRDATVTLRGEDLDARFAATLERCRIGLIPFEWDVFVLLAQHLSPGSIGDDLALVYAGQVLPASDPRWFELATRACSGSELATYAYSMLPPNKRPQVHGIRCAD